METLKRSVRQTASPRAINHGEIVQQLMFNRILAYVRLLSLDHVNVTRFDTRTGSIEGSLAGVSFIVKVGLQEERGQHITHP